MSYSMKKSYNPISDVRNESVDLTKRLYRSISDVVHILDEQRGRAATVSDLFVHSLEVQRIKLRDYCEQLMFFDPIGYGRKGEELLWRKGYYDVVSSAKRLRKGPLWKPAEICHLRSHLQAGIGHYHHLLLRLQLDYKFDLRGIIDFPHLVGDNGLKKGKTSTNVKEKQAESDGLEWAHLAVHRCLIYLGDLSRYLADLCPGYHVELPARYYSQALNWKPDAGMPYNQLGTLSGTKNFSLDAAYYYMRCMQCSQSFEGAEGNLAGVLERNAKWLESGSADSTSTLHHLIGRFLYIADICFFDKVTQQGVQKVCEEILSRMSVCLSEIQLPEQPLDPDDVDTTHEMEQLLYLTDEMLFKMAVMALMCMQHLQEKGSDQINMMIALTLAIMSQLIEKALVRIECVLPPRQPPITSQVHGHCKRRRRRRRCKGSSISSDLSEDDVEIISSDSDLSEEELVFDAQSSESECEEEIINDKENGVDETKKYNMCVLGEHPSLNNNSILAHIQHLCVQGFLLQTIKICCDWLFSNAEVLRLCRQSSKLLISRLVSLLNHLAPIPVSLEKNKDDNQSNCSTVNKECDEIPLVEEVCVRGLANLKLAHSSIDWPQMRTRLLTPRQETYVRICKMVNLGQQLTTQDGANIVYNAKNKWFEFTSVEEPNEELLNEESSESGPPLSKGKLMHDMGQLWLRAEVRELETKVKHTTHLPPYLVLDCDALIHHITLVKQLVSSRKFIVLIPSIVVSELDEQKRISRRVRDTIRWLETQFHHGNRFLRAQRSNEHLTLPLIKYPKKKDKEAWLYFQVVECCHYLSLHSVDNMDSNTTKNRENLVTLLTGSKTLLSPTCSIGFSPLGVAKSAGINVEHIETFHSKWKNSSKSHG